MLPVHTILHPTDFSERSEHAFRVACALTRDYNARLVVLHVASPPLIGYAEGIIPPDPQEHLDGLRHELNSLEVPDDNVRAERKLVEGNPVTEILRVASETNADLIVMGTHGRTGLGRLLMGSVAEMVVRQAPCPVLTIKAPFHAAVPAEGDHDEEAVPVYEEVAI